MISKTDFIFTDCVKSFVQYLGRNNYSMETISGYERDLKSFKHFIMKEKERSNFPMEEILKHDLLRFMDAGREKGHKTNTIARRISTLKSFYKYLVYELDYPFDVAASIRVPKAYIPLPPILTENELKLLLRKAQGLSSLNHLLFSTLYFTGFTINTCNTTCKSCIFARENDLLSTGKGWEEFIFTDSQ